MSVVSMRRLLENGVHFGHQTRRWNPKMKPFIYTAKNGVYIINLEKTQEMLDNAYAAMREIGEKGGKVLFVGTKKSAQEPIVEHALRSGSFYISQRWLGGTLTNFRTIQKRIKRLVEIEELEASGTINLYPKKEIALINKEKDRLENFLGGIKEMKKLPDALFVVDPIQEHNAVAEANKLGIPVFGLIDTNADPSVLTYPIPANDDAVRSVKLLIATMADALVESKGGMPVAAFQEDPEAPKEDVTMDDVMVAVTQHIEEMERRRRQRNEEARRARENRNARFNNSERRSFKKNDDKKEAKPAAEKTEKPAEVKAEKPAEVKEEAKESE